jgi:hypothetical protein
VRTPPALSLPFHHRNVAAPVTTAAEPNSEPNSEPEPNPAPDNSAPDIDAILADLFQNDNAPATTTATAAPAPANTIFDPFAPSTSNHVFVPGQPPIVPSAALQASVAAQQALDNMHSAEPASMAGGAGATGAQAPLLVRCVRRISFCGSAQAVRAYFHSPHHSNPIRSPVIQTLMDLLRSLQNLRRDYNTRVIVNSIHTVNKAVSMLRTNSNKAGHVDHNIAHVASAILVDFTASISFE